MLNVNKLYKNLYSGYYYTTSYISYLTTQTIEEGEKDVDKVDLKGFTKLHIAVEDQNLRETIKLISQGADVNKYSTNEFFCTPLHISVNIGNFDLTEYLLQNSANIEKKDFKNRTALQIAALNQNLKIVELLIYSDADVNIRDSNNNSLLHSAILQDDVELIKILMKGWIDSRATDSEGRTSLQLSVELGRFEILSVLIESETTSDLINARTTKHNPPLHIAVSSKNLNLVKKLVSSKAKVDILDNTTLVTPLYIAVINNLIEIANFLVSEGKANVNFLKEKESLLDKAIAMGHTEIAEILIEGGADYNIRTLNNAISTDNLEIVKIIVKKGIDLISVNDQEASNLLCNAAIIKKNIQIVKILIENGISVSKTFFKTEKKEYGLWKKYDHENRDNILQIIKLGKLVDKIWKGEDIDKKINIKENFYDILYCRLKIHFTKNHMNCDTAKKVLKLKSYVKYLPSELMDFVKKTIIDLDSITFQLKIYDTKFVDDRSSSFEHDHKQSENTIEDVTYIGELQTKC